MWAKGVEAVIRRALHESKRIRADFNSEGKNISSMVAVIVPCKASWGQLCSKKWLMLPLGQCFPLICHLFYREKIPEKNCTVCEVFDLNPLVSGRLALFRGRVQSCGLQVKSLQRILIGILLGRCWFVCHFSFELVGYSSWLKHCLSEAAFAKLDNINERWSSSVATKSLH